MQGFSLEWIAVLVFVLCALLFAFFILTYRFRVRVERQWRRELREDMTRILERRKRPTPPELTAALDRVTRVLEKAASAGKSIVRIRLSPKVELQAVASDTLSLRMLTADGTWVSLYKSFERLRIEKISRIARGYELRVRST